jgi:crotonobetainyl-CoA:carnitine CoA-transferase CaiB-like acyl-CoA transferase
MIAAALSVAAEVVIEQSAYGADRERTGNRSTIYAPQGIYPTSEPDPVGLGDRRWVSLSVVDDASWQALCSLIDRADWATWTELQRHQRHDEIDAAISEWTSRSTVDDVVDSLLARGVAVGEVVLGHLVPQQEQLEHRGFFERIEHAKTGINTHASIPVRWSSIAGQRLAGPAPMLGEHDDAVWLGQVGLSDEEYRGFHEAGVIGRSAAKAVAW